MSPSYVIATAFDPPSETALGRTNRLEYVGLAMTASASAAMIDTFAGNGDNGHSHEWPNRRVASLPPGRPAQILASRFALLAERHRLLR